MRAGELRHRVTVERRSMTQDTFGGQSTTWTALGTFWAWVQPASGREIEAAAAQQAEISHTVTMRYNAAIWADPVAAAAYRLRYGSRILDVKAVRNEGENNAELTISALEGLTQG